MSDDEVDYDDLIVHRAWRSYETQRPDQVRYMMFEVSQRNPGDATHQRFYKAVRFIRLTRVPRWLRQQGTGVGRPGGTQMAYVLAALREQGSLFVQLVAKTADQPLIYAYGAQGLGASEEEAQQRADDGYAALVALLDGTFQQIEHQPLSVQEGEAIALQSATWEHVAMARGKPVIDTASIGASAIFDGNRTDVEQTHNAMEAFIRGMSESQRGFMLTLVTVPLAVEDMTLAWRNIAERLSQVRSETTGSKAFNFGMAIPLSVGSAAGVSHGDSHTTTAGHGSSTGFSTNETQGTSTSLSTAVGDSTSLTQASGQSTSLGMSDTATSSTSTSVGVSDGQTTGVSQSFAAGESSSLSAASGQSTSLSTAVGESTSLSHGTSLTATDGTSLSSTQTAGTSEGLSAATGVTAGTNTSASLGTSDSWASQQGNSGATSSTAGGSQSNSQGTASGSATGSGVSGGFAGFIGGNTNASNSASESASASTGSSWGSSNSSGWSQSASVGGGQTATSTQGSSLSTSTTATSSTGVSNSVAQAAGVSSSLAAGSSSTMGSGASMTSTAGSGVSVTNTAGTGTSLTSTAGSSQSVTASSTSSQGVSSAVARGVTETSGTSTTSSSAVAASRTETAGTGTNTGVGQGASWGTNASMSDAYAVALSRQASQTGSLGVVPSFGVSVAKNTLDAGKMVIGDILEATMRRYLDGVEGGGGFLYQLFLVAEDRDTLLAGAALLKSAFWGAGTSTERVAQPFHVIVDFAPSCANDPDKTKAETQRLLAHARAFTSYRRREPIAELVEPFLYSSYASANELAALCRPPVAEGPGLLAVHDSAPVLAMPSDRQHREITLGRVFNGERARISNMSYGVDVDELTHVLISGVTGSGKTTLLMKLLADLTQVTRTVVDVGDLDSVGPVRKEIPASVLAIDWMRNMRHLGTIVPPVAIDPDTGEKTGRFQFFSVRDGDLGAFAWNPLAIPDNGMNPVEWLNAMADTMVGSWNLGEFGRSLIAEYLDRLYRANRLEPFVLRPARTDDDDNLIRPGIVLDPIDPSSLPPGAIAIDPVTGNEVANVFTCPELSRLVGIEHLAVLVASELEAAATVEGGRQGTSVRDRLQSLWRRVSYFAPGGSLSELITFDRTLDERRCLLIDDLVDVDRGLVTVIETDGLDLANRRFVLGSVFLALYRTGLHRGEGCFNHHGKGPGLHIVLEEAHELFGSQGEDEDGFSASTRTAYWESAHRRIRALGARLIDVVQNPADVPEAITSNISTVMILRTYAEADRRRVFSLLNWSNAIGQQLREWRWLGEMPVGYAIVRLHARSSFLESAPVQIVAEQPAIGTMSDVRLRELARMNLR